MLHVNFRLFKKVLDNNNNNINIQKWTVILFSSSCVLVSGICADENLYIAGTRK